VVMQNKKKIYAALVVSMVLCLGLGGGVVAGEVAQEAGRRAALEGSQSASEPVSDVRPALALAEPPPRVETPAPVSPVVIPNPVDRPDQSIDDFDKARQHGWPALVFFLATSLAIALGTLGERHPKIASLARLNQGIVATVIGAVAACGTAGFEAAIQGGSWATVGFTFTLALAAFWKAQRTPAVPVERNPEVGSAAFPPMLAMSLFGVLAVFLAGLAWSCAPLKPTTKDTAGEMVDCTLVAVGSHADELEAAIRDATNMDGEIDWQSPRAMVRELQVDVAGCALRLAIERLLASPGAVAVGGQGDLRAGWERIRTEELGGRRYLPDAVGR
jgi:hypothetical protein